jgi:hypothetical protein
MGVRHEDRVELADRVSIRGRPVAAQRSKPVAKDGVGQEPNAIELDEQRRVAEIRDPDAAAARLARPLSRSPAP